jgi:sugar lactone lactonase YvrE
MKRLHAFFASFALFASFAFLIPARLTAQTAPRIISTFAGEASEEVAEPEGQVASTSVFTPTGVAVDASGVVYIADFNGHRILRKEKGVLTVFAGMGTEGFSGDGGPARLARLSFPSGVAVDSKGDVFIADTGNHRVRRVGPDGKITTIAGVGHFGFCGDGGLAVQASLNGPMGVAVDSKGDVFIADAGNHRVRCVRTSGLITTVAGIGCLGLVGDEGPATQAALGLPMGVAVDAQGVLYISDRFNQRIRRVGPDGVITTLAGGGVSSGDGGPATQAGLRGPCGVAVDPAGNVYIADQHNERVRRVGVDGIITTIAGNGTFGLSGDGWSATQASLNSPAGVAVGADGTIYIADRLNHRIRRVEAESTRVVSSPSIAGLPPR